MAFAAVEPVLLAVERLVDQAVHARGEGADGQVQAVVQHPQLQVVGAHHRQVQVYRGVLLAVGANHLGQRQGRVAHGGVEHAEVEGAAQLALERGRVALEAFQFAQQTQGLLVEQLALAGQAEAGAPAMAEAQAHLPFQLAHVGADGRGGKVQLLLRGGEALVADHAGEDAQEFQVGHGGGHG
ncbi:hypothetical protein D3C85_1024430 [compost metagenome]